MRVIFKNDVPRLYRLACKHCGSLLEVSSTELSDSGDQREPASKFTCCACGKCNYVAASVLTRDR